MGTTILRFEKIKSMANIRGSGAHQFRHHADTPNADSSRKNLNHTFLGSENLAKDVQARLDTLTKQPRKNAVLAMDGLVTLSPELFEEKNNVFVWGNETIKWLKDRFGENLVSAVVHRDESNAHMHFTVVPIDEKSNGRRVLNARDMFDKWQLADMQRSYNEAMRSCIENVQELNHGSKASHTKIKQFYTLLDTIKVEMEREIRAEMLQITDTLKVELEADFRKKMAEIENKIGREMSEELKTEASRSFVESLNATIEEYKKDAELEKKVSSAIERAKIAILN